jgi:hypothetical protein
MNFISFYGIASNFIEFHRILMNFIEIYSITQDFMDFIGSHGNPSSRQYCGFRALCQPRWRLRLPNVDTVARAPWYGAKSDFQILKLHGQLETKPPMGATRPQHLRQQPRTTYLGVRARSSGAKIRMVTAGSRYLYILTGLSSTFVHHRRFMYNRQCVLVRV